MFGESLPEECDECGEDVAGLYDHGEGCEVAARVAQREIDRIEGKPRGWELPDDEEKLQRLREIVQAAEGEDGA